MRSDPTVVELLISSVREIFGFSIPDRVLPRNTKSEDSFIVGTSPPFVPAFTFKQALNIARWLSDTDIMTFFEGMIQKAERKIKVIDPLSFSEGNVCHWLKPGSKNGKEYIEADTIFVPMTLINHWYLIIFLKLENNTFKTYCLDGKNCTEEHGGLMKSAQSFLTNIFKGHGRPCFFEPIKEKEEVKIGKTLIVPQQDNCEDCGVVTALFGYECLIDRNCFEKIEKLNNVIKKINYSFFRKTMEDVSQGRQVDLTISHLNKLYQETSEKLEVAQASGIPKPGHK